MGEVSTRAANIVALAAQADTLVSQFRTLMQNLEDEEKAIFRATQKPGEPHVTDAISGRRRLAHYAINLAQTPASSNLPPEFSLTVLQLATKAWSPFLG